MQPKAKSPQAYPRGFLMLPSPVRITTPVLNSLDMTFITDVRFLKAIPDNMLVNRTHDVEFVREMANAVKYDDALADVLFESQPLTMRIVCERLFFKKLRHVRTVVNFIRARLNTDVMPHVLKHAMPNVDVEQLEMVASIESEFLEVTVLD